MNKTTVFALILCISCLFSTIRLTVNVTRGKMILNRAKKSGQIPLKCRSAVFKGWAYIFAILLDGYLLRYFLKYIMIMYQLRDRADPKRFTAVMLVLGTDVLCMAVSLIIHILAIFLEKYAYLTSDGLVYFMGCFKFSECRFNWEAGTQGILSDTLHVYKKNDSIPFTVVFGDNSEAAHRITDEMHNINTAAFANYKYDNVL